MGTLVKKYEESVNETNMLMPMIDCSSFACWILESADKLVERNLNNGKEVNGEILSKELCKDMYLPICEVLESQNYSPDDMCYCYIPRIEGGNYYNSYLKTTTNQKKGVIDFFKYSVGIKLGNYCCHIVRSVGLYATKQSQESYKFMMLVNKKILENLKNGIALCEIFNIVKSYAEETNSHLSKYLENDFGFELGPKFKKGCVNINSSTEVIAQDGMFFATNINLIGLEEEGVQYDLYHSDTVAVRKYLPGRVLSTTELTKFQIGDLTGLASYLQDR